MNIKAAWRAAGIQPYNPDAVLQPLLQKLEQSRGPRKSSDGRHVQRPTSTPSKFLAWQTPRNRRQLRHQKNAAIDILSKTANSASAIDLIRKLSQQTEAEFARAEISEIETANLRTKYAGKKARAGPGGRKKLTKGTTADWKFLERNADGGARKGGSCGCKSQSKGQESTRKGREEVWGRR